MAKPVVKKEYTFLERIYLWEIVKGLKLTFKHFTFNFKESLKKGPHTVPTCWQYPEDRRPIAPVFRGAHMLCLDDEGRELCVGCGMCARACPAKCITVKRGKPAEGEEGKYAGKTMSTEFTIDMLRCIFCGFCEEACPKGAIQLGQEYELAEYTMDACIYDKERLLANFQKAKAEGKLKPPKKPVPVAEGDKKAAAKKAAQKPAGKEATKSKKAASKPQAEEKKASESKGEET